jgi:putative glycerol-1-phosphate prenyltransferase
MSWLDELEHDQASGRKRLVALLDPDDLPSGREWIRFLDRLQASPVTDIFIGGSLLIKHNVSDIIQSVRERFDGPVVIFPGSPDQVVKGANALLFLSLISGRNPELLIGRHVESAMRIRRLGLEIVPTGYMLFGNNLLTTASYMSQTRPIPLDKPEIAAATAAAGEMLGLRVMFADAGSGASQSVTASIIASIKENTSCPLIVGGGLRDAASVIAAWNAGADVVVIGNALEKQTNNLSWLPDPSRFSKASRLI